MRIKPLSPEVANQIAAGEVIERPASVVKELLENSLDAGALSIQIEIEFGGLNRIKIADDGYGILAEDLPLAITAHATSKITQLNDLYAISSMGFRGEALASIASVSRLTISSRPEGQVHAMQLMMDDATFRLTPCPRTRGTTVDVVDLFFNAPVRKKFLKSERSEYLAIENVVKRFALSAPQVSLNLKHNGKQMLLLPSAHCEKTKKLRIQKLLGTAFTKQASFLHIEHGSIHLQGWIGSVGYQRSQNDKQWFYINQRMVREKLIQHAVMQAYDPWLYPGRYPACLLYLTVPADKVDINVHPTKHEVRFQEPRLIHDLIASQVSRLLHEVTPAVSKIVADAPVPVAKKQEAYSKALNMRADFSSINNNWVILNPIFAVFFLQNKPYLIDVEQLRREHTYQLIMSSSLPLASRPLLVPVSYNLARNSWALLESYQSKMLQLGVQIDLMNETEVIIRSIPLLLPQLDIKKLLQVLPKGKNNGLEEWIGVFLNCHSFDAQDFTQEERDELTAYLSEHLPKFTERPSWLSPLEVDHCRMFLRKSV